MPNSPRRIYWDSCVFLSYIENHPDRASDIDTLLQEAEKGNIEIVTSTVAITEVAFAPEERDKKALSKAVDDAINALWRSPSPVKLVEFHAGIADRARDLLRTALTSGIKMLKPMDAIHLATALTLGVDEFQTYDEPLMRYSELFSLKMGKPFVDQTSMGLIAPPATAEGTQ
jgi:predicted nucleic acid-binding protein